MNAINIIQEGKLILKSKIKGDFKGFDTETLFPLANRQFWIQSEHKYWYYRSTDPSISIYKYKEEKFLIVDGQSEFVCVEQVTDVLEDTIVNEFTGWTGDTVFELNNGQIWQQNEYSYRYHHAFRPTALIYSVGPGYKMLVEGEGIRVKRIE
jgi:hypothetical protein